jgi:polysaccharide biosynthesis/export protein
VILFVIDTGTFIRLTYAKTAATVVNVVAPSVKTIALLILGWSASLGAQAPDPAIARFESLPEQKVGAGDLLGLAVTDCPELTRNFRVAGDGTLPLPLLKQRIRAAGKQPDQIAEDISSALMLEEILVRPAVSVAVVEYRSVPVSVLGAVKKPITLQAIGPMTLMDALTKAEGLAADAGPDILVTRTRASEGGAQGQVQRISVKALIDEADPSLNIRLYGGEEIRVPPAGKVYVVGNVKRSGAFPISDGNDITVLKMIALSEGLLPFTYKEAFIYRRIDAKANASTGRNQIQVELGKIIDRKSPDVALQPNDILYIPDSKGRRLTAQTLERIASFGSSTGTGLLVWH